MLKGEAKKIYQRKYMKEYMRDKRKQQDVKTSELRPSELAMLDKAMAETERVNRGSFAEYVVDADGNPIYDE